MVERSKRPVRMGVARKGDIRKTSGWRMVAEPLEPNNLFDKIHMTKSKSLLREKKELSISCKKIDSMIIIKGNIPKFLL